MPQSLSSIYLHVVFSTKGRAPLLGDDLRPEIHRYMGGILKNMGCQPLGIGGVEDHVHLLLRLGKANSISSLVRTVKINSTNWAKVRSPSFNWQSGYGAFSFAASELPGLQAYVNSQEEHHKKVSFQDEFRQLLRENGIEWHEDYVWD